MERDEERTREHVRLLSIFHWVLAAAAALFALVPVIHLLIGVGLVQDRFPHSVKDAPPHFLGWILIVGALAWIVAGLSFSFCLALSALFLTHLKNRTFCLVIAGMSCLFFPLGTLLGVFTIVILTKDSARALFTPAARPTVVA